MNKKELIIHLRDFAIVLAVSLIMFFIVFFRESPKIVLLLGFSMIYLYVFPGYLISINLSINNVMERVIIGISVAILISTLASYYLGELGLHIKYHVFIIPIVLSFGSICFYSIKGFLK